MRIHRSLGVESLVALMAAHRENELALPRPPARPDPGSVPPVGERLEMAGSEVGDPPGWS